MGVSQKWSLYAVQLHVDGMGAAVNLDAVSEQEFSTNTEFTREATGGNPYVRFLSITGQQPQGSFSSYSLARALDTIPFGGLAIASTANPGVSLYAYKHAAGGTRASGTAHRQYLIKNGIVVPRQITIDHRGEARLGFDVVAIYDGANNPVVINDGVAVPVAAGDDERFTLGPCEIGGLTFTQKRNLTLDFGHRVVPESADGDVWSTFVSIEETMPELRLAGIDVQWLKSDVVPLLGAAAEHADTNIYFRKRERGGTGFVDDATEEHIQMTAHGLAVVDQIMRASASGATETSLQFPLAHDGTNIPAIFDTTTALP